MLKVKGLTKYFGNFKAVDGISFGAEPGKILGLLGPNGAGKTTTIRMILNIIPPSSGEISFNGQLNRKDRYNRIGYLPEERGLYQKSRVKDVLSYFASLKGVDQPTFLQNLNKWSEYLDFKEYLNTEIGNLSKGNQQKIQFAASILHNPEILILDEPFSGFDPLNQEVIKKVIHKFLHEGKIILLSTHLLDYAEDICSEILLLNKGKEILKGDLSFIKKNFKKQTYRMGFDGDPGIIQNLKGIEHVTIINNEANILLKEDVKPHEFLKEASSQISVNHFSLQQPSLNEIFMHHIKSSGDN